MIVQENITINNKQFVKTYSDAEFYIKKKGTDEVYVEAIDLPTSNFEYIETEDKIEKLEEIDTETTENKQLMQWHNTVMFDEAGLTLCLIYF